MNINVKLKKGVPTLLGTTTLRALNENELSAGVAPKRFVSRPRLSSKSTKNVIAKFKELTKDSNGNIIEYKFNILYTSTGKGLTKKLNLKWIIKTEPIQETIVKEIKKLFYGNDVISTRGETRRIVIKGDAGASFGLAVNETFTEQQVENDEVINSYSNPLDDVSILKKENIRGKIPKSGIYTLRQDFPSSIIKKTVNTSAVSGSAVIPCDATGLRVGDRLITSYSAITGGTNIVEIVSIHHSLTQIAVSSTISSLPINSSIYFSRNRSFNIKLLPDLTPNINSSVKTNNIISQYQNPLLTLTHTAAGGIHINSGGGGVSYVVKQTDRANSFPKTNNLIEVRMVFTGKTFGSIVVPTFSQSSSNPSSWSNTDPKQNGGTELNLVNFKYSGITTATVTVDYTLEIVKWGNKNINIAFDTSTMLP